MALPPDDPLDHALDALAIERASSCLLDARGRILAVNRAWDRFAEENGGGPACRGERVVGTPYAAAIDGAAVRAAFEAALARALGGASFAIHSECSSPERLRVLRTQHLPVRGSGDAVVGVMLVHAVVHEAPAAEARTASPPDEGRYRRGDGLVLMCSCCRRVHRAGSVGHWDFVPAYLQRLPAPVTHGLCESCVVQYGAGDGRPPRGR